MLYKIFTSFLLVCILAGCSIKKIEQPYQGRSYSYKQSIPDLKKLDKEKYIASNKSHMYLYENNGKAEDLKGFIEIDNREYKEMDFKNIGEALLVQLRQREDFFNIKYSYEYIETVEDDKMEFRISFPSSKYVNISDKVEQNTCVIIPIKKSDIYKYFILCNKAKLK